VEVALKMSLQYWLQTGKPQKTKFIYLKGGYHGETLGALSVCGMSLFREKFEKVLPQNMEVEGPDCLRCPFGLKRESCNAECFEPMEQAIEKNRESVAGVILEPLVQGAAGMKMYPPVYLKKLEDACKASDVHVIYDEVAVGFGRTGSLFVSEHHGLNPTFMCLSKGITSGYLPLAATLTTDEIYQAFYGDYKSFKLFIHSHSYSANPLACAAANATLDLLTEAGFMDSLKPKIESMHEQGKILSDLPWCGEFRQTGMIAAVELVRNREMLEPFPVEQRVGHQIFFEGLKREVILRPLGNVVYFIPPLVIEPGQIETMMNAAHESITAVLKGI
jgi:adenosylmethionine-8-amino-7-oxononanoate aminotransferase